MTISVRVFAGAAEACGVNELASEAASLESLVAELGALGPDAPRVLERCSFLVDGVRTEAPALLVGASTVDVLPPFAGG